MYNSYISHVTQYFGVTQTRPIYESAVATLPDIAAKGMCLRYAELERKLGEIDRARALYQHASQFSDPRTDTDFWEKWQEFEVQHGNEETYKEMRRLKRSVQLQFTQMQLMQTNIDLGASAAPTFVAAGDIQGGTGTFHGEMAPATDAIAALESQGAESVAVPVAKKPKSAAAAVPDANEIVRMLFHYHAFVRDPIPVDRRPWHCGNGGSRRSVRRVEGRTVEGSRQHPLSASDVLLNAVFLGRCLGPI